MAESEHLTTLTDADVGRIEEATGLSAEALSELEWLSVDEARAYEERRPLYAGYFASAPARRTLRRRGGARFGTSACLAVEEASTMKEVLEAFGTTCAEVEALGERLREEVAAHGRARPFEDNPFRALGRSEAWAPTASLPGALS